MVISVVPSLSRGGWIASIKETMSSLFEAYLAADYSQSDYFLGNIVSLKYDIAMGDTTDKTKSNIKKSLEKLYGDYFSSPTVVVTSSDRTDMAMTQYKIDVTVMNDSGETKTMSKFIFATLSDISTFDLTLKLYYEQRGE